MTRVTSDERADSLILSRSKGGRGGGDLDRIIHLLETTGQPLEIGAIARRTHLERAAVRRALVPLQQCGAVVERDGTFGATGDVLSAIPLVLAARRRRPRPSSRADGDLGRIRFGDPFEYHRSIGSTNDRAAELSAAGVREGALVVADTQTHGRGRMRRGWLSPAGVGIFGSLVLRPPVPPARASELSFVSAVAVAEAVRAETRVAVEIKWPNDILAPRERATMARGRPRAVRRRCVAGNGLVASLSPAIAGSTGDRLRGRKIAGILAEMHSSSHAEEVGPTFRSARSPAVKSAIDDVIVGIGINVNHHADDFPGDLLPVATSLALETGRRHSRVLIACRMVERLATWYARYLARGFRPVLARWCELSPGWRGAGVEIRAADRIARGVTAGIDPDGALRVRTGSGPPERFLTGDVIYLRWAQS